MGTFYDAITDKQAALIAAAKIFFIASAGNSDGQSAGPVNLSPKGGSPLHVLSAKKVAFLDFPGSGNETARHVRQGGDVTVMIMAHGDDDAAIVRLYGKATVRPVDDSPLAHLLKEHATSVIFPRPRQIVEIEIHKTQTSCGYGVPVLTFMRERDGAGCGRKFKDPRP